jgi:hypothetical protein
MHKPSKLLLLAASGLVALGLAGAVHADSKPKKQATAKNPPKTATKFYKWIDDEGKVHYTEHLPPESTGKNTSQLNKHGSVVRETDRALTPEERLLQEQATHRREEEAKTQKEEERKNVAVMSSYSSEKDIDSARERALASNSDAINSANHNIEVAMKRKEELTKRSAGFQNKPKPEKLEREIESNETDLRNQQQLLNTKKREAEQINARYDEDKRRFLRLTKPASSTASIAQPTP